MKQAFLACVSALALGGSVSAADLLRPLTKPPILPPLYNWTRFYLHVNGGRGPGPTTHEAAGQFDISGGASGGASGYNWQRGPWVFGCEGDVDWSRIKGHTALACPLGCETRNSWLATARGRIGYASYQFLPYVTGGVALGN